MTEVTETSAERRPEKCPVSRLSPATLLHCLETASSLIDAVPGE
jgi:hypothetical protein